MRVEQRRDLIGARGVGVEWIERVGLVGGAEPHDPGLSPGVATAAAGVRAMPGWRTARAGKDGSERRSEQRARLHGWAVMTLVFASCGAIAS